MEPNQMRTHETGPPTEEHDETGDKYRALVSTCISADPADPRLAENALRVWEYYIRLRGEGRHREAEIWYDENLAAYRRLAHEKAAARGVTRLTLYAKVATPLIVAGKAAYDYIKG